MVVQVSDFSSLEDTHFKSFSVLIPSTISFRPGVGQIMKFALFNVLRYAYFEAGFVTNLSTFEPQIEKHHAKNP